MRLTHLELRGFMTAFAGKHIAIDFDALPPGLIALVGENGAGKTTVLEAGPAAVYRTFMSRGALADYAMDRDAFLDAHWDVGENGYRTRVNVDGVNRTTDAVLAAEPGIHLNDGKATTFDRAVSQVFPPLDLFKASAFAAQDQSGAFVSLGKKERRELFAGFIGADRLIRMADTAKEAAEVVQAERDRWHAQLAHVRIQTDPEAIEILQAHIRNDERERRAAEQERERLDLHIIQTEQLLRALAEPTAAYNALALRVSSLDEKLRDLLRQRGQQQAAADRQSHAYAEVILQRGRKANAKREDLRARIANNKAVIEDADAIRAAVLTVAELDGRLTVDRLAVDVAQSAAGALMTRLRAAEQQLAALAPVAQRHDRATTDAALLGTVPCGGEGDFAACGFLKNAITAKASLSDLVQQLEPRAALAEQIGALTREHDTAAATIRTLLGRISEHTKARDRVEPVARKLEALKAAEERIKERTADLAEVDADEQRDTERDAAAHAAIMQTLADAITDLNRQITTVEAEHRAAQADLDGIASQHEQAITLQAGLTTQRQMRDEHVARAAAARERITRTKADIAALEALAAERAPLEARIRALDTERLEWALLASALGRDGIPNFEIEAAGPGISATTNELLHACFDGRFSVELVTQVPRADGKGMKDEFTVQVTDNANGDVRDLRDLSGGEKVIVSEAFMNAIAIYVNERSETPMRTCFRDETTGPLSAANTARYMAMLRKVQERGRFHQVLFISHAPESQDLADAQLVIADGHVTVALPPFGGG